VARLALEGFSGRQKRRLAYDVVELLELLRMLTNWSFKNVGIDLERVMSLPRSNLEAD